MFCIILFNDSSVSILAKIMIKYSGQFLSIIETVCDF